jgi:protocatechuate 4,5-dioxygenase beta chain/2,3-dihydroxyphenylpropionate 1,2-dioxygenase
MPLVAAVACPHTPQLLIRPETEDRELVLRVHAAYAKVKAMLSAVCPDVVCVIAGDHVEGFFLNAVPAFAVYAGASVSGKFGRYDYTFPVHEPLARAILEQGIEREFDLTYSQDVRLDYAFFVPLHFTMPDSPVPIVPLYVNVYLPPQPTPRRCYAWGKALREILDARPERIVLMASGGMSHYPGTPRYPNPDFEFDRRLLASLERGEGHRLIEMTPRQLDEAGNIELRTWMVVMGMIGADHPATVVSYEPCWHHGHGVLYWDLAPARAEARS